MDQEIKREIIMENYLHPHNKETTNDGEYLKVNSKNESCIDNIDLQILIKSGRIKDIKFNGEACAISTASTSIMIKELIKKTIPEALDFIHDFEAMINENEYNKEKLGEASVFDDIFKQKNRKNCATLPYKGMIKALEEYQKNHN